METLAIVVALAGIAVAAFALWRMNSSAAGQGTQALGEQVTALQQELQRMHFEHRQELTTQLGAVTTQLVQGLTSSQQAVTESHKGTTQIIANIQRQLTSLEGTNKQVLDFSSQLQRLQEMLRNPKQRGVLGEYYLETLLKNVLAPGMFQMQYKFSDGEIVDAAVFINEKIVPIDAKFSLENYNRLVDEQHPTERERLEKLFINDLKLRVKETAKYIRPDKGTMDFAFMFIPHEAIYYDLLVNRIGAVDDGQNILQRAAGEYKVIVVSPTSFLAYLQTVLMGLNELRIEKEAIEIRENVAKLEKHIRAYAEFHEKIGKSLGTTVNHYNKTSEELRKVHKDTLQITGGTREELLGIDRVEQVHADLPVGNSDREQSALL